MNERPNAGSLNGKIVTLITVGAVFFMLVGGAITYLFMRDSGTRRVVVTGQRQSAPAVAGLIAPAASTQSGAAPRVITEDEMKALAARIVQGDSTAMTKLELNADDLYRGINYQQERPRVMANLQLMHIVYDKLGAEAARGNAKAMAAIKTSLASPDHLRSFAPDALGIAAAGGNTEALDMLVHYKSYGILESSAVFAMAKPAQKNIPAAVDFLIKVIDNPKARPLWYGASTGLAPAALAGNTAAKEALERFEADNPNNRRTFTTRPSTRSSL